MVFDTSQPEFGKLWKAICKPKEKIVSVCIGCIHSIENLQKVLSEVKTSVKNYFVSL